MMVNTRTLETGGGHVARKGEPGFIAPGSPEWSTVITPSKVAAILGLSRWESPYRLWHRMKGIVDPEPPKDAFDIGHDMEPYAAARWSRLNPGWHISSGEVQFHPPAGHFPFPAIGTIDRRTSRGSWRRIVECKVARNLGDAEKFGDPDLTGDCPPDYAAQVIAQRLFVAATQPIVKWDWTSHLLAIGPYYNERLYTIEYDSDVVSWMIEECEEFYTSLGQDVPPDLDDSVATYECLRAMHPDIDGTTVDVDPVIAAEFLGAKAAEKAAKAHATGASSAMLDAMGNAQYARVGATRDDSGELVGGIVVADRRNSGRGSVALYAGRTTVEKVMAATQSEGTNA